MMFPSIGSIGKSNPVKSFNILSTEVQPRVKCEQVYFGKAGDHYCDAC